MQYPSPDQSVTIKLVNRLGRGLEKLGVEKPRLLPTEMLIQQAKKQTGLSDFGDESFMPALDKLAMSLEREASLSQLGRIAVHAMLVDNLKLRLSLTEYRKQRPEIARQKITRPLFVLGLPRTGTTILYELLRRTRPTVRPVPGKSRSRFLQRNARRLTLIHE